MGDVRLYLDGAIQPVVAVYGGSLTSTYNTGGCCTFRVGARDLGHHTDADFDEVALWDVDLTAEEVAEIYNDGVPTDLTQNGLSYSGAERLQLYWRFEEGQGTVTADSSGNGHDGVVVAGDELVWTTDVPGSRPDRDGDGVADADDNCPDWANYQQADSDGDGIGDACQCGDQGGPTGSGPGSHDGHVDLADIFAINDALYDSTLLDGFCDTNLDEVCNLQDLSNVLDIILGLCTPVCRKYPFPGDGRPQPCR